MQPIACLSVLKHKRTGAFSIINFAEDEEFGFCVASGKILRVSHESMEEEGLEIVLRNLREYSNRRAPSKTEFESIPKAERPTFDDNQFDVGISLREQNTELWLSPMEPGTRGGAVGEPEKRIVIKLPCDNSEFYERLNEAFGRCG